MDLRTHRFRVRHSFEPYLPQIAALVILSVTFIGFYTLTSAENRHNRTVMSANIDQFVQYFQQTLNNRIVALSQIASFYNASTHVNREEFRIYTKGLLLQYPDIKALEWIPELAETDLFDISKAAVKDGLKAFKLRELAPDRSWRPLTFRAAYYPVYYIEPLIGNEQALGFDLGSTPTRINALQRSRDYQLATASAPLKIVQEQHQAASFRLLYPVFSNYSENEDFNGFVAAVIRFPDIISSTIATSRLAIEDIVLQDITDKTPVPVFPYYNKTYEIPLSNNTYIQDRFLDFAGRRWHTQISVKMPNSSLVPYLVLVVGFLLAGWAYTWLRRELKEKNTIRHRVNELTSELVKHNAQLEYTVKERTKKLAHAVDVAEQANAAKTAFLANMSHEFRTPMHAILSFSKLAFKKVEEPKIQKYLNNILSSSSRLTELIDNLLDLSKLEAGKTVAILSQQNIPKLLKKYISELHCLADQKNLDITLDSPSELMLDVDEKLFAQLITNLLSNAIKFSEKGGKIEIIVNDECDPRHASSSNSVHISVTDNGIGIPENELETVFDKFIQSSKTVTGSGGTGLGLAICKEIMSAHNGKIWAESYPKTTILPGRTSFHVRFPITPK